MSPIVQQTRLERVWLALMPSPTEALGLVVLEYLWGGNPLSHERGHSGVRELIAEVAPNLDTARRLLNSARAAFARRE